MTESRVPLPAFEDPPVIETLLGVQFAPPQSFSILHFGLYGREIQADYPHQEIKPPLNPAFEEFERPPAAGSKIGIDLLPEPAIRCWFIDATSTQLIQIQKDRFIRNWRKTSPEQAYPRYDNLKPRFQADWERFCTFLHRERLGAPEVNQCEVTYVNHIQPGGEWGTYGQEYKLLTLLSATPPGEFLSEPEMVQFSASYLMPDKRGRLHIALQPVIRWPDPKEVLQLTLTARGKAASSTTADIIAWFDLGHEWIVRGFADITTREMHRVWRRTK